MKLLIIYISFILVHLAYGRIFKQIITAKALSYDRFHVIDYKTLLLPSNLYDLTISINFVKWTGFLPLCPKDINITSILQYGTFPLFKHDSEFQHNIKDSEKISIFTKYPKMYNNSTVFSLKSPKSGIWFLGSIYDSNDEFNHYVICSVDLRIELIGLVTPPVQSVLLTGFTSPHEIPLTLKNPDSLLLEIKSNTALSALKVVLQCRMNALVISSAIDSVPQIHTIAEAKQHGHIYKSGDVVMALARPEISLRVLLQIRAVYEPVVDARLVVHFARIVNDGTIDLLGPSTIVKETTMFTYQFSPLEYQFKTIPIVLRNDNIRIQPFFIQPLKDQGGVLSMSLFISQLTNESLSNTSVYFCVSETGYSTIGGMIEAVTTQDKCLWSHVVHGNSNTTMKHSFYYPRWGWWYVTVMARGSDESSQWKVDLDISSTRCNQDGMVCNGNGLCLLSGFDDGLVASCHCYMMHYGLDCKNKHPPNERLVQRSIYRRKWLVLSNLAFIPAIVIAAIQRIYLLSVVYFVTMVSSMTYHICSTDDQGVTACILPVEQLTYYDHIAASFSIWVSLVVLTTLSYRVQSILNVSMLFAIIVMGQNIQRSVWMYAAPVTIGVSLIIVCWIYRMSKLRCIFPPIDWWMFGLVPGLSLVVAGTVLFRLSTYEQYQYFIYHSIWHILISLSVCFIIPNSSRWLKALTKTPSRTLLSTEDLGTRGRKWRKFKKNVNYYLHLDVLIDYLVLRNPNCLVLKSY